MSPLYYFRSSSLSDLHGFTDDGSGRKLPAEKGPWRLLRIVAPDEGWTSVAEIDAVRAGIHANGFFLTEHTGELTFTEAAVRPGD
jgi:hypothetical protein